MHIAIPLPLAGACYRSVRHSRSIKKRQANGQGDSGHDYSAAYRGEAEAGAGAGAEVQTWADVETDRAGVDRIPQREHSAKSSKLDPSRLANLGGLLAGQGPLTIVRGMGGAGRRLDPSEAQVVTAYAPRPSVVDSTVNPLYRAGSGGPGIN